MRQLVLLRTSLIAILTASNLLLLALSVYVVREKRHQEELQAQASTRNVANALHQNLTNSLGKIDLSLRAIVDALEQDIVKKDIDTQAMNTVLARYELRLPEVDSFRVIDQGGQVVVNADSNDNSRTDWSQFDFFKYHQNHSDSSLQLSKPLWNAFGSQKIVVLSRRFDHPDGRFAGVVIAQIAVENFTLLLSKFELGTNGAIEMRYADLGLITRFPVDAGAPTGAAVKESVPGALRALVKDGITELRTYRAPDVTDGVDRMNTFRRLDAVPIILIASEASQDYLAHWRSETRVTAALVIGTFLLSLLAGGFLLYLLQRFSRETNRSRMFLKHASDGIAILECDGKIVEINDRLSAMTQRDRDSMTGAHARVVFPDWDKTVATDSGLNTAISSLSPRVFETRVSSTDGTSIEVETSLRRIRIDHDGPKFLYVSVRDITERKQAQQRIQKLAYFDPLTELANRQLLMDRFNHALASSNRTHKFGALMVLNIDGFKTINETAGHAEGDRLLVEVGEKLSGLVRKSDTVARFGGDEFAIVMENVDSEEQRSVHNAVTVAEKIRSVLDFVFVTANNGQPYDISVSIGVTLFYGERTSTEVLYMQADLAMHRAKGAGRNIVKFFDPEMQSEIDANFALVSALKRALELQELHVCYQPQVDERGKVIGVESLLRWNSPVHGNVSPAQFIPIAEKTGLILPIGEWVLWNACEQLKQWEKHPSKRHLKIAVNVSAIQFRQPNFVALLSDIIKVTGIDRTRLKLELTESVVLHDSNAVIERMQQIRELGLRFSLDDFGTGFSSLSYLKKLPLDQVKIDQSFVRNITTEPKDAAIVTAIIAMSNSLDIEVIAEGVETMDQMTFLRDRGCLRYQGYLFGRPMPVDEFERLLPPKDAPLEA